MFCRTVRRTILTDRIYFVSFFLSTYHSILVNHKPIDFRPPKCSSLIIDFKHVSCITDMLKLHSFFFFTIAFKCTKQLSIVSAFEKFLFSVATNTGAVRWYFGVRTILYTYLKLQFSEWKTPPTDNVRLFIKQGVKLNRFSHLNNVALENQTSRKFQIILISLWDLPCVCQTSGYTLVTRTSSSKTTTVETQSVCIHYRSGCKTMGRLK